MLMAQEKEERRDSSWKNLDPHLESELRLTIGSWELAQPSHLRRSQSKLLTWEFGRQPVSDLGCPKLTSSLLHQYLIT